MVNNFRKSIIVYIKRNFLLIRLLISNCYKSLNMQIKIFAANYCVNKLIVSDKIDWGVV